MGAMSEEARRLLPMAEDEEPSTPLVFERIAIVGLGLIGGSLALAARKAFPRALVIGVDRNAVLEKAMVRHAIDVAAEDLMIASEADLVVLAAPVGDNLHLLSRLGSVLDRPAVVTDVGSTKRAIMDAATQLPPNLVFVGGHPLAGSARSGIDHARADLFTDRPWLFTPGAGGDDAAIERLATFVTALGAVPKRLGSAAEHDHLVAFLSHLPQLAVSGLMDVIGEAVGSDGLSLSGRGLGDTTRLAASPAGIWRDICATNADEIASALDAYMAVLQALRADLAGGEVLQQVFERAAQWRAEMPGQER